MINKGLLYSATGLVTAVQIYRVMMWSVWGSQPGDIVGVALLGSILLVIAGLIGEDARRASVVMGIIGLIPLWVLFGPSVIQMLSSSARINGDWLTVMLILSSLLLLGLTSVCSLAWALDEVKDKGKPRHKGQSK